MHTISKLSWDDVLPIWKQQLWPTRTSPIETHSAMTWPFEGNPAPYDINIFNYPVTYLGAIQDGKIIGTFSGFKTTDTQYRLRGAWVDAAYRKQGVLTSIIHELHSQAIAEGAKMVWCTPRKSSYSLYLKLGYTTRGDFFGSETSDANIYVTKEL